MKLTTRVLVILVLLRITIGWHFLYEGLWKLDQDNIPEQVTTSRYVIYNATSGLRGFLSGSLKDAASMDKLTPTAAQARVDQWFDDVSKCLLPAVTLAEDQKYRLAQVRDNMKRAVSATLADPNFQTKLAIYKQKLQAGEQDPEAAAELRGRLENAVNTDPFSIREQVLKIPEDKAIHFSAQGYLQNSQGPFRRLFRRVIPDLEGLDRLTPKEAQERVDKRYNEVVSHYRSAGVPLTDEQKNKLATIRDNQKKWIEALFNDPEFLARLGDYKSMLEHAKSESGKLTANFTQERLMSDRTRMDTAGALLLGYVNEPLVELGLQAQKMATAEQMKAGTPPAPAAPSWFIDWCVKWGLVLMGLGMLLGLFTPWALAAAALQLAAFYFATPPWPGLPVAPDGGHYLYVDRNLIELVAVLVLLAANTGRYGLDALMQKYVWAPLRARRQAKAAVAPAPATAAAAK